MKIQNMFSFLRMRRTGYRDRMTVILSFVVDDEELYSTIHPSMKRKGGKDNERSRTVKRNRGAK